MFTPLFFCTARGFVLFLTLKHLAARATQGVRHFADSERARPGSSDNSTRHMASNELTIYEGKRIVRPRQLFVAEPVSSRHISAALQLLQGKAVPSEITAEDAARAFAVVPRPLPFCLPRRAPRSRPRLSLGFSGSPGTPDSTSPATDIGSCSSTCFDESPPGASSKQLRNFCNPGLKETSLQPDSARHARYGTVTSEITSVSDFLAADEGEVIDMVSGACGPLNAPK